MELVDLNINAKKVEIQLKKLEVIELIKALDKYSYSKNIGELERKKIVEMKSELKGILSVIELLPKAIASNCVGK